jgi:hypothetical protein
MSKVEINKIKDLIVALKINSVHLTGEEVLEKLLNELKSLEPTLSISQERIPRPPNMWVLYRSERLQILKKEYPNLKFNEINDVIVDEWKTISEQTKNIYAMQAEIARQEHKQKYPFYVFKRKKLGNTIRRKN